MRWLMVVGVALGLLGVGMWRMDTASGQDTQTKVVAPSSWSVSGGNFQVQVQIEQVADLGSYEWQLTFDPAVIKFESVANGPFLGSTGREPFCPPYILDPSGNAIRFGCATTGATPAGPNGSGLLSTVTFSPVASGASNLDFAFVSLSDASVETGGSDIPSSRLGACIAIGAASCVQPTVAPPVTATAAATATPGGTDETPIVGPTNTPTGPLATPTPLPPGMEAVDLVAGCNPVTSTYTDGTPIQTIADAVGPAANLASLWLFEGGVWRAFSPQYPQASDLTAADLLDVLFACVAGPGAFVRPII